ncbi:YjfB family protein [Candidatus Latescibacterota bacterium]
MDPFGISAIADAATALSQGRLHAEMSVRTMKKALDVQEQAAIALIESAGAVTSAQGGSLHSPPGVGAILDIVA